MDVENFADGEGSSGRPRRDVVSVTPAATGSTMEVTHRDVQTEHGET